MNENFIGGGVALAANGPVKIPTDFQSSGGSAEVVVIDNFAFTH